MRFQVLDGWRGICALLVAIAHLNALTDFYYSPFIRNSYLFVDFFFILSGFVITHAYSDKIQSFDEIGDFILRRFGRLWPLHISVLLVFILIESLKMLAVGGSGFSSNVAPFTKDKAIDAIVTNISLIHSLGVHEGLTWNFPSWSISAEFFTYLCFAAVSHFAPRRLYWTSAVIVLAALVVIASLSTGYMASTYDYGFFRCLVGFFSGVIVYNLFQHMKNRLTLSTAYFTVAEFSCLALVVVFVSMGPVSLIESGPLTMIAPLIFGIAVFIFAFERGSVSQLLHKKPFQLLGTWSYSIYMIHALVLMALNRGNRLIQKLNGSNALINITVNDLVKEVFFLENKLLTDFFAAGYIAIVIATAAFSYRFIEEPGRKFFNGLANRRHNFAKATS